jgi:peptidoglycan hydrolase CwlO-like protein
MKLVWWVVFLIFLAFGLSIVMWLLKIEPVFSFVDGIVSPMITAVMTFDISKITAQAAAAYAMIAGLSTTALGGVYKWIKARADKLNITQQLTATRTQAQTQIAQASQELQVKDQTLTALTTEKAQLTTQVTDLQATVNPLKNQVLSLQTQLEQARQQLTGISKMNVDTLAAQVSDRIVEKQRVP